MSELYVGLISGTSVDGIDAVLLQTQGRKLDVIEARCFTLPPQLTESIHRLCSNNELTPSQLHEPASLLAKTHSELGFAFGSAVNSLLKETPFKPSDIRAIGSHGQTVLHEPPVIDGNGNPTKNGFSLQIGCPQIIGELTGIDIVSDFRSADMTAGGQGAPLAPAFHAAIAPQSETVAFLNLGGIANITLIENGNLICGYDTGPANTLMDAWIQRCKDKRYDKNGQWARSGKIDSALLSKLLADPYFHLSAPKSTGREYFHLTWLKQIVGSQQLKQLPAEDIQATLIALTVQSIANEITLLRPTPTTIYCCGGGSHNKALIDTLKTQLPDITITTTNQLGIDVDYVEAALFAWLAMNHIENHAIDLRRVTGAKQPNILGVLHDNRDKSISSGSQPPVTPLGCT